MSALLEVEKLEVGFGGSTSAVRGASLMPLPAQASLPFIQVP